MMGYEFANPGMLWGCTLAAIPLAIHLFHRRRARPHRFAAIDFILRSRRRTAHRLRLKRLLLFLIRTLFFLVLPVALARPHLKASGGAPAPAGPAATAIVLDTSLSMSYVLDGAPLLERARGMARDVLAGLAPEDPVTLVTCEPDAPAAEAPHFQRARVRERIDSARQTFLPIDLTACLGRAARALGESSIGAKRIVLASDLTASAFRLDVPAPVVSTAAGEVSPEVVLLDAAGGAKELANAAVMGLKIDPAPAIGNRAFQFSVTVANFSSNPVKDLKVLLRVGRDVVAKGFVDVPPRGTAVKALSHRFPAGGVFTGEVELTEDSLKADDTRFWVTRVPQEVKALVVNGSPHPVRFMDEAFFVEAALTAPGSPVRPTLRDAESAAEERFADYDLFLLLNARSLPKAKVHELAGKVERGGGLFLSLGDQVDPDVYNDLFGELLPRKLHLVKTAAERREEGSERKASRLSQVAFDHPALSVFAGEAREGLLAARTYKYFLLAPGDASQVKLLASYDDGAPALVEARRGHGRVILYTSSVDRDWTDWPIQSSFLPAMQRLSGWLAGALDERAVEEVLAGDSKVIDLPSGTEGARFKNPEGKELSMSQGEDGKRVVAGTQLPGIYRASLGSNGKSLAAAELDFAVNVDPRESDLTRLEERELKAYFGEQTRTQKGSQTGEAPPPIPAWSLLLALAVGLLLTEGILLRS
jgi:hypothetical protein